MPGKKTRPAAALEEAPSATENNTLTLEKRTTRSIWIDSTSPAWSITSMARTQASQHQTLDAERMLHFFALDEENPASIYNWRCYAEINLGSLTLCSA